MSVERAMSQNERFEKARREAKRELLLSLINTAQRTQGAEVWRLLFAEMLARIEGQ